MRTFARSPYRLIGLVIAASAGASVSLDGAAAARADSTSAAAQTSAPSSPAGAGAAAAPANAPGPGPATIPPPGVGPGLRFEGEPTPCPIAASCPVFPGQTEPEESPFGYDGGLYLRTRDRNYSVVVNGFAQLLYVLSAPAGGGAINQGFYVSLARLALSGNIFSRKLSYFFQFEGSTFGNNNGVSMLDWWMQYKFNDYLSITAGRFILAYSRQFYTHPGNLLFADLSAADYAFNMPRAIGVKVGGTYKRLSYDVFLTNSVRPLGVGTQINRGDSIATGARLELAILQPYGYMESMPKAPEKAQLSIGFAAAFNPVADDSGFQNVQAGDDTVNITADLGFRWQRLSVQGAFYYRHLTNFSIGESYGFYGQAGIYLIRERLELTGRATGALLADRLAAVSLTNQTAGSTLEYTGGLNAYLFGHGAKLQTDYSYVTNDTFGGTSVGVHRWRVQTQVLF